MTRSESMVGGPPRRRTRPQHPGRELVPRLMRGGTLGPDDLSRRATRSARSAHPRQRVAIAPLPPRTAGRAAYLAARADLRGGQARSNHRAHTIPSRFATDTSPQAMRCISERPGPRRWSHRFRAHPLLHCTRGSRSEFANEVPCCRTDFVCTGQLAVARDEFEMVMRIVAWPVSRPTRRSGSPMHDALTTPRCRRHTTAPIAAVRRLLRHSCCPQLK